MMEVAVATLSCPFEMIEVAIAELLDQYEEMAVAELLIDLMEWKVHVSQVMMSVFGLTVYTASVVISAHLRKFCADFTI
jgi:hypothetical protein